MIFDIEEFPPTSSSIKNHILRSYFQCNLWYNGAFTQSVVLNPEDYGYKCEDDANMTPLIIGSNTQPESFPIPCNCDKCASEKTCICRIRKIKSQLAITCSKLTIETLEQGEKYVQS